MCGIIAYHNKQGITKANLKNVLQSLDKIKHRGIDGEGVVLIDTKSGKYQLLYTKDTPLDVNATLHFENYSDFSADLVLAHRRLSIIDLSSNGFQPMKDKEGNLIIFNGEVYNYVEIKKELENSGYHFETNSDTEVILKAYIAYGKECLSKFNGMWSIIIWDNIHKKLFVSNDRFGIKPLYYYQGNDELIFASEIKAYHAFKDVACNVNINHIKLFLDNGILDSNEQTFLLDVKRFPKAHFQFINFADSSIKTEVYWTQIEKGNYNYTEKKAIEEFNYLITDAIKIRLRADVECGIALSGGLDSSVVCYYANNLLKERKSNIKSFSVIFPGLEGDESYFSKYIVNDLKLDGKFVNPFDEFNFSDLENLNYHLDYPMQSTSYYASWCLMRFVSQNKVKVLLEGQGADELFAGYHHHFYKYGRELLLRGRIKKYFFEINAFAKYKNRNPKDIHKIIVNDVKLLALIKLGIKKNNHVKEYSALIDCLEDDLNKDMLPAMLRGDDRSSMAFGVETRLPFMDYRLVEFSKKIASDYKIHNGWQKYIIRQAAEIVPDVIRYRPDKKGFTNPQEEWMKKYKNEFESYSTNLEKIGLDFENLKNSKDMDMNKLFRIYSLGIWLDKK